MRKVFTLFVTGLGPLLMFAHSIDFNKIRHWTGEGPNRAALAIQFNEADETSDVLVWGFQWEDYEHPSGEDMFKAICANSDELVMLTQYTGQYGATLCGVGFGNAEKLLDNIYYDFEMAVDYPFINFDFYKTNSWFGQEEAPGDNTPEIVQVSIDDAYITHVIQHPLDYKAYGYPAYDYDCWFLNEEDAIDCHWESGWYEGYWSFWLTNSNKTSDWMYSGTGFTGTKLEDGTIHGWSYTRFEEAMVGGIGEGVPPSDDPQRINYRPENGLLTNIEMVTSDDNEPQYYKLSGLKVNKNELTKGIYLVRKGNKTFKQFIK